MFEKFFYSATVLDSHLDVFGHMNNAVYLELYEKARWKMITKNGYGLAEVQELQQGPIILDVHCKFLKELRLYDVIRISCQTKELGKAYALFEQTMFNEKEELCSQAIFKFALFDLKKRKLVPPTERWLRAIGVHSHRHKTLR